MILLQIGYDRGTLLAPITVALLTIIIYRILRGPLKVWYVNRKENGGDKPKKK